MNDKVILAEVERRKQRARDLGLVDLVFRTYLEVSDYGTRSERFPDDVPPEFREARGLSESSSTLRDKIEGVILPVGGRRFVFCFKSHASYAPDDDGWYGTLSLSVEGAEVFSVACSGQFDEYVGLEWKPGNVEGFIEGDWMDPLRTASAKVFAWKETRAGEFKRQEEANRLETLKKKFGL